MSCQCVCPRVSKWCQSSCSVLLSRRLERVTLSRWAHILFSAGANDLGPLRPDISWVWEWLPVDCTRSDPFCQTSYERVAFAACVTCDPLNNAPYMCSNQQPWVAFGPPMSRCFVPLPQCVHSVTLFLVRLRNSTSGERRVLCGQSSRRCARSTFSNSYLVDPASSDMLVSKIKPCMCK